MVGERKKKYLSLGAMDASRLTTSIHGVALMGFGMLLSIKNEGPDIVREIGWSHYGELEEENDGWV